MTDLVVAADRINYYSEEVRNAILRSVEGILDAGRVLVAAKAELAHGEWLSVLRDSGVGERSAQYLMKIANHPVLSDPNKVCALPSSWRALAELASGDPAMVEGWVEDGTVNPDLTVKEAKELVQSARPDALPALEDEDEDDSAPDRSKSKPADDGPKFAETRDAAVFSVTQAANRIKDALGVISTPGFRLTVDVAQDLTKEGRRVTQALGELYDLIEEEHPHLEVPREAAPKVQWKVVDTQLAPAKEGRATSGGNTSLKAGETREATMGGVSDVMWRRGDTSTITLEQHREMNRDA